MQTQKFQIAFAKLEALHIRLKPHIDGPGRYFDPAMYVEYFKQFELLRDEIISLKSDVFSGIPIHAIPPVVQSTDFDGRGYFHKGHISQLLADMKQLLDVKNIIITSHHTAIGPKRIFISHGRSEDWRQVQAYIDKDLKMETLELAQSANRGRTVLQKLDEESGKCSYAVVVMTGDDKAEDGTPRARENVMHEIGFFQGKFGLPNVCLLYEEGTNIPSNIHGLVYLPYPKDMVRATYGDLSRELQAAFCSD